MILIAGCGFVGSEVVRQLLVRGEELVALTHSEESAETAAREFGIRAIACDIGDRSSMRGKLTGAGLQPELAISCVSSGRGDATVYRRVYFDGIRNLHRLYPNARILFVSSTSVYAQNDGAWLDETFPAEPKVETGKVLRQTEDLVQGFGGVVVRPGGIYGPGRSVLLKRFFQGDAVIENDGARYLNQIHRDDVASAIVFLSEPANWRPGEIYNVTDSDPMTQLECYEWLAQQFNRPLPPRGELNPDRKRGVTNKRVSNAKLRALGWTPRFSSFREGAMDCVVKRLS